MLHLGCALRFGTRGGLTEPGFETRLAESRVVAGNECRFAQLRAVVACMRVSDNLTRILTCRDISSDQFIKAKLFRPAYFKGAVYWWAHRDPGYGTGDILGRHGLDQRRWQAYLVALGGNIGDALDEFEELSRVDNGVGDGGPLDQILLRHFCAEVAACEQTISSYHGQRNVMFHARACFKGEEVTG